MWLVGMMGTGKSAAGRLAADRLGVGFADTDELIAEETGRSVAQLWESEGEAGFRARERDVVAALAEFAGIVATGGGTVLDEANRSVMAEGTVIWLRAGVPVLAERLGASSADRPLLSGEPSPIGPLARILEEREGWYRTVSHHEIDTESRDSEEIAERIARLWKE